LDLRLLRNDTASERLYAKLSIDSSILKDRRLAAGHKQRIVKRTKL